MSDGLAVWSAPPATRSGVAESERETVSPSRMPWASSAWSVSVTPSVSVLAAADDPRQRVGERDGVARSVLHPVRTRASLSETESSMSRS